MYRYVLQSSFWTKKQVVPEETIEEETELAERQDPAYFETPPKDMYPGIRIVNVSKVRTSDDFQLAYIPYVVAT